MGGGGGGGGGGLRLTQGYTGNLTIFFQRISHQLLQPLPVQNRKIEILCQPCCHTERSCRSCCNLGNEGRSFWLLKRQSNGIHCVVGHKASLADDALTGRWSKKRGAKLDVFSAMASSLVKFEHSWVNM